MDSFFSVPQHRDRLHPHVVRGRGRPNGVRGPDTEELTISSLEHQSGWVHRRVLTELSGWMRVHPLGFNFAQTVRVGSR